MPEGIEPVVALAIGYPGDSQSLGEELRGPQLALETPPRVEEFVFTGVWGRRASALKKPERVHGWLGSPILLPHWG